MNRTYRTTGINLKSMPLGESDRLVTILTREEGLIRAVAKGSRKQPSKLGGRMEPFVVNDLLLAHGGSDTRLQRIAQAETLQCFPRLSRSLEQLTAAQYLAEVTLMQALSGSSQNELFVLLVEHLERLEQADDELEVLPLLTHGLYHLLALSGIAPQTRLCHYCRTMIRADREAGFSFNVGGLVCDPCTTAQRPKQLSILSTEVLKVLQQLSQRELDGQIRAKTVTWIAAEHLLRRVMEYHSEREIRSAALVDSCWSPAQGSDPYTNLHKTSDQAS